MLLCIIVCLAFPTLSWSKMWQKSFRGLPDFYW
jgi:hypothetical protein